MGRRCKLYCHFLSGRFLCTSFCFMQPHIQYHPTSARTHISIHPSTLAHPSSLQSATYLCTHTSSFSSTYSSICITFSPILPFLLVIFCPIFYCLGPFTHNAVILARLCHSPPPPTTVTTTPFSCCFMVLFCAHSICCLLNHTVPVCLAPSSLLRSTSLIHPHNPLYCSLLLLPYTHSFLVFAHHFSLSFVPVL